MPSIQHLPESVYARIAAGEVIVNPAAAVKELIENAIDAGATGITVEVADGGKELIRVTDNGSGMDEKDLPLAIARHATSKIRAFDDLYTLTSLGFRGEALSSMAEVSRISITSRKHGAETGAKLTAAGGAEPAILPAGAPEGTTVRVEDLFFNVPARRKFLKAGAREGALVSETVRRAIIAEPGVAFKYIRNGRVAYQSPGDGVLRSALGSVYGPEALRELLDVQYSSEGITVEGCVSRPTYIFKSAQRIDFFVNSRYIQSKPLQKALMRGYGESLLRSHYPCAVLNIRMDSEMLDINVHPAKLTAMFSDEEQVLRVVTQAVREVIGVSTGAPFVTLSNDAVLSSSASMSAKPNPDFWVTVPRGSSPPESGSSSSEERDVPVQIRSFAPAEGEQAAPKETGPLRGARSAAATAEAAPASCAGAAPPPAEEASPAAEPGADPAAALKPATPGEDVKPPSDMMSFAEILNQDEASEEEEAPEDVRALADYRILGNVFATYVVCESGGRVFFVDQHAARERLTYEEILDWVRSGKGGGQMLLIPIVRTFPAPEFAVLKDNAEILAQMGLSFEEFGELTLRFFSLPTIMGSRDIDVFLAEVVEELLDHPDDPVLARDKLIASACRHSVKAGTTLTDGEMETLMREITTMDSIPFCPHGRPIAVEITKDQLEKGFRRRV